ncbi:hypothetical protein CH373_02350 [Leptospira perolatii]|uniref:MBL fold metallo-hydrolase n=1 Tax=Leptospira perolatii TaxID=2023191 RepID=A0A2M9ZSJ4_9LEPT|nr:MBL fold metallo-hydrolase [Leptospira perolatii]PJZ71359.1 hypothetical protein CH360_02350 [Leptospira perolatii]PJZ74893.1 hypothetical protein CH373_02350 [Leptospira perolatii]
MIKRIFAVLSIILLIVLIWIGYQLNYHPSLDAYKDHFIPIEEKPEKESADLKVTFLGVSTLLVDDGQTAFMTDGFFTRPGLLQLNSISPNKDLIVQSLGKLGVKSLAAVIPVHSHYDHALDSAVVAELTNADLVGSESTRNIGLGFGLPENRIKVVTNESKLQYGKFKITILKSSHIPGGRYLGEITSPITNPTKASEYKMGDCYSVLVEHGNRSILIQGSAGFIPGALKGHKADVVYLGVSGLGKFDESYLQEYWKETMETVGAKRAILVHWDDFFEPLDGELVLLPPFLDNFDNSIKFLLAKGKASDVDIRIPIVWKPADPFTGLKF